MAVELTSPVDGKAVGDTYTGPLEGWFLAQGYAKQAAYTGPGVANTGATDVDPGDDPTLAENRGDKPRWPVNHGAEKWTIANDVDNLTENVFPHAWDFDADATDTEAPTNVVLSPATGSTAGGDVIEITGDNLEGVTSVTFGGTAGTSLEQVVAGEDVVALTVVTPAKTAGAVNVVLVDTSGNTTLTSGFTFA